jgi:hypothetical protein
MRPEERRYIARVLGEDVARVTADLEAQPSPGAWRQLLCLLLRQHADVMASALGQRVSCEVIARIYGNEDARERLPASWDVGRDRVQ